MKALMMARRDLDDRAFNDISQMVYDACGINLGTHKKALVSARLSKRLNALGIDSYRDYINYVNGDSTRGELTEMVNVISTNVTSFFREIDHFVFLQKRIKDMLVAGQNRIRIWCAACSTGEEPYTIALVIKEIVSTPVADIKILASDIDTTVLDHARKGIYREDKLKPIALGLRDKYFRKYETMTKTEYEVKPSLREWIVFKRLNLINVPYQMAGPFDFIFCRNVMIYFDNAIRQRILSEMYRLVRPGGNLIVGHAEGLTGMMSAFKPVKPSIYVK